MLSDLLQEVTRFKSKYPLGSIGIEVEAELPNGKVWDTSTEYVYWKIKSDGSLVNGAEAVSRPLNTSDNSVMQDAFEELVDFFKKNKGVYLSERASTHIHWNCQSLPLLKIFNVITGYYLLENALIYACTPSRRGNHFCLALSDSIELIEELKVRVESGKRFPFPNNEMKYSSLNVGRLVDFGTLEVRIMNALLNADDVFDWALLVNDILSSFISYKNPNEVLKAYLESPEAFLVKHIGTKWLKKISIIGDISLDRLVDKCNETAPLLIGLTSLDWDKPYRESEIKRKGTIFGSNSDSIVVDELGFYTNDLENTKAREDFSLEDPIGIDLHEEEMECKYRKL